MIFATIKKLLGIKKRLPRSLALQSRRKDDAAHGKNITEQFVKLSQDMHKIAVNNDTFDTVFKKGIAPFERFVKENL